VSDQAAPVIALRGVGRCHAGPPTVDALIDVDLEVAPGELVAVTGPSGAGKSTLLQILGLLDRPTDGSYTFEGIDTRMLDGRRHAALRATRIGFVFQSFHLLPHLDVVGNVELGLLYAGCARRHRRERALAVLDDLGVGEVGSAPAAVLSGGEQQRVAIARAIVREPALLLCDEPTGNLDQRSGARVLDLLDQLNERGATIVIATHDPDVAARATRCVQVRDGRIAGAPS